MKLLDRPVVGDGLHRSGWPMVMQSLAKLASGQGILLDDFADASFSYWSIDKPYDSPWVGIFHHPVEVRSPFYDDDKYALQKLTIHPLWPESIKHLVGAIALCGEVAEQLGRWLKIPVICLRHPTDRNVPAWQPELALQKRQLIQVGYCLRNTQLIFGIGAQGWKRTRLYQSSEWLDWRDEFLRKRSRRKNINTGEVLTILRLDNASYDTALSESVVVTQLYGAAANNLIVECAARGTPIVVNRLKASEEYLGDDYPLFYNNPSEITALLDQEILLQASKHLLGRLDLLPSFDQFAVQVLRFVESLE